MTAIKTVCPLCGEKSKSKNVLTLCPVCNVSLQEPRDETLIKKAKCSLTPSGDTVIPQSSLLFLTNRRIFWLGDPLTTIRMSNSAIPAIMDSLIPRQKQIRVLYRLDEITNIEIKKKGPFKALVMAVVGGTEVVLDVKGSHREEWITAVNDARKALATITTDL